MFLNLYKQFVRPHLEFSVPVWCPWQEGDKLVLEKLQISGLQSKEYEEKLKELNIQSLEERRIRYDVIQVIKLMHNYDDVDRRQFFQTAGEESVRVTRLSSDSLHFFTYLFLNFKFLTIFFNSWMISDANILTFLYFLSFNFFLFNHLSIIFWLNFEEKKLLGYPSSFADTANFIIMFRGSCFPFFLNSVLFTHVLYLTQQHIFLIISIF